MQFPHFHFLNSLLNGKLVCVPTFKTALKERHDSLPFVKVSKINSHNSLKRAVMRTISF